MVLFVRRVRGARPVIPKTRSGHAVRRPGAARPACSACLRAAAAGWPAVARSTLERRAQARGRPAPAARRERGAPLPRARRSHLQARAMAPEGGRRPRRRAQGARGGGRQHRARRGHAAHRRAQHGGRAAPRPHRATRPFGPAEVALMAKVTSPASGQPYGIRRVCQAWGGRRRSWSAAPSAGTGERRDGGVYKRPMYDGVLDAVRASAKRASRISKPYFVDNPD